MSLLHRINRYLDAANMPPTRFGRIAVNDPRLVQDLRRGRELGERVRARVEAMLAEKRA